MGARGGGCRGDRGACVRGRRTSGRYAPRTGRAAAGAAGGAMLLTVMLLATPVPHFAVDQFEFSTAAPVAPDEAQPAATPTALTAPAKEGTPRAVTDAPASPPAEEPTVDPTPEPTAALPAEPAQEPDEQAPQEQQQQATQPPTAPPPVAQPTSSPAQPSAVPPVDSPASLPVQPLVEPSGGQQQQGVFVFPGEKPVEPPVESPVQSPVESPIESPVESPVENQGGEASCTLLGHMRGDEGARFSTFLSVLDQLGMLELLGATDRDAPLTLLAPTNEAYAQLEASLGGLPVPTALTIPNLHDLFVASTERHILDGRYSRAVLGEAGGALGVRTHNEDELTLTLRAAEQDELQGPLVAGVPTLISVSAGVAGREALVHEIDEELCDGNVLYVIDRVLF